MLTLEAVSKRFGGRTVLDRVSLRIAAGEYVAVIGDSGIGKSTLLNAIAGLEPVDAGRILFKEKEISRMEDDALALMRRDSFGFVFQAFHVLPHLTVAANVGLPLLLQHAPDPMRVSAMMSAFGLAGLEVRLPHTISGGQLQRVAIARALVHRPKLILADEPTGNLDPATAERVLSLLVEQVREHGAACVLATHSRAAAARADRSVTLTPTGIVA